MSAGSPIASAAPGGFRCWLRENKLGFVLLPFAACAASVVVEKIAIAIRLKLFSFMLATSGAGAHLSLAQRVALVRADFLLGFVVVPLAFALATYRVPFRWRIYAAWTMTLLVQATTILETASLVSTGAFSSIQLIWFGATWTVRARDFSFLKTHYFIFAVFLATIPFLSLVIWFAWSAVVKNRRWVNNGVLITLGLGALVTLGAYAFPVADTPWSQNLPRLTVHGAFFDGVDFSRSTARSANELVRDYRAAEGAPAPQPTAFTGHAKDYNVLLFVMEAMPADALDPARDSLADLPNIRSLRDHAFVPEAHFTTYPLTDDATFSIFTSLYASADTGLVSHQVKLPGLIQTLDGEGYATGFYGFVWNYHRDRVLISSLGFEKINETASPDYVGDETFFGPEEFAEKNDHEELLALKGDIRDWTRQHRKFAAAYFPEVSHDPYRVVPGCTVPATLQCAHALAVIEDAWLGELLGELRRDGALNNTLIVVTGDHGWRFTTPLQFGRQIILQIRPSLSEAIVRTPMLVYAPGVLKQTMLIKNPTSHIDISPTLLDLLGISEGRDLEQGSPMYLPAIASRRLYLDMALFGASGFVDSGQYSSRSNIGVVYKNDKLQFDRSNMVPFDSNEAERVRGLLQRHGFSERDLLKRVLSGND